MMVPVAPVFTLKRKMNTAVAPLAMEPVVHCTFEELEGFEHIQPSDDLTDSYVVPTGVPKVTVGEWALSGPWFVRVTV